MTMSASFSEFLGKIGQWNYYKVKASGQMTSSNVKSTCESNGLVNTCVGSQSCGFSGSGCTVTALTGCSYPMNDLSKQECNGNDLRYCPLLNGVFSYMHNYAYGACGALNGIWCSDGRYQYNQWALCADRV